jgi:hypothetical protein
MAHRASPDSDTESEQSDLEEFNTEDSTNSRWRKIKPKTKEAVRRSICVAGFLHALAHLLRLQPRLN